MEYTLDSIIDELYAKQNKELFDVLIKYSYALDLNESFDNLFDLVKKLGYNKNKRQFKKELFQCDAFNIALDLINQ